MLKIYLEDRMLTERELHVLYYIAKGYSNEEIGKALFISKHTAKSHVSAIIKKMNVKTRAQATYVAAKKDLLLQFEGN